MEAFACGVDGVMLPGMWRSLRDLITKRSGIGQCLLPAATSGNKTTRRSKRGIMVLMHQMNGRPA